VVEALNAFELAAQEAERKHDAAVLAESQDHIKTLKPKTAKLTIHLPPDAEEVEILLDHRPLSAALSGTPLLIDPGERHLAVTAKNYDKPFNTTVTARPGDLSVVNADLGGRKAAAPLPPLPPALPLPSSSSPATAPRPPREPVRAESRAPIYIAGGATVALGAGALIAGLVAHDKYESFQEKNNHPKVGSFAERKALRDSGQALAVTSTVMTFAALLGGGVTAFFLLRGSSNQPSAMMWSPWVGVASAGVSLGGAL